MHQVTLRGRKEEAVQEDRRVPRQAGRQAGKKQLGWQAGHSVESRHRTISISVRYSFPPSERAMMLFL